MGKSHDLNGMSKESIWESDKGTFMRVVVIPNSKSKELVAEASVELIRINLVSPAREGKANIELVKKMAKFLGISTSSIAIVAGQKSREKTLLIDGLTKEGVVLKLQM